MTQLIKRVQIGTSEKIEDPTSDNKPTCVSFVKQLY